MVRKIVQTPRDEDETWVDFILRATHCAEGLCRQLGYEDWTAQQYSRKLKLSNKLLTGTQEKWSARMLTWTPWFRVAPWRRVGRP